MQAGPAQAKARRELKGAEQAVRSDADHVGQDRHWRLQEPGVVGRVTGQAGEARDATEAWDALFVAASVFCALAPSPSSLVAARFLQGLGAAAIMSLGVALFRFSMPRSQMPPPRASRDQLERSRAWRCVALLGTRRHSTSGAGPSEGFACAADVSSPVRRTRRYRTGGGHSASWPC